MADLTEAIEAAQHETGTSTLARIAVEAAAPIIERQALERAAQALADWAEEHNDGHISGPRATLRRHILMCARRITPAPTMQEVADALMRGDYVACNLDDAGRAIAPARGYTQPAETPGQDRKDT